MTGTRRRALNRTLEVAVQLASRRHGGSYTQLQICHPQPSLLRALLDVLTTTNVDAACDSLADGDLALLEGLGVVVPIEEIPKDVRFGSSSWEKTMSLLPTSTHPYANLPPPPSLEEVECAALYGQLAGEPVPRDISNQPDTPMLAQSSARVWVVDPTTTIATPIQADGALFALAVGDSRDRSKDIASLPEQSRARLRLAGGLFPAGGVGRAVARWDSYCRDAAHALVDDDCVVIRNLLPPLLVADYRCYLRELHLEGYFCKGDRQSELRDVIYREWMSTLLHPSLARVVSRIVGEPLAPTYCYLARYGPGSDLPRHVDRPQCAWNLSLALDAEPEMGAADAWPIYLETRTGRHCARLALGDAVLYPGTRVPHWRAPQRADSWSTFCFYHFVPAGFTGSRD